MELTLRRIAKRDRYTIGKLYIDGQYFCDTLEDKDRGWEKGITPLSQIQKEKVYGESAIPTGRYRINMDTVSPKYSKSAFYQTLCGGKVPRIENVPGFDGILIHSGNGPEDTYGCILVGENKTIGKVLNSKATFTRLYNYLYNFKDKNIFLNIY